MTDKSLNLILDQASAPPPCPSDKLVANMFAHMDAQVASNSVDLSRNRRYLAWGSMAAALLVAFGIMANLPNSFSFGTDTSPIVATNDSSADSLTATATTSDYADDFANQLIGYDDISVIVPINDL